MATTVDPIGGCLLTSSTVNTNNSPNGTICISPSNLLVPQMLAQSSSSSNCSSPSTGGGAECLAPKTDTKVAMKRPKVKKTKVDGACVTGKTVRMPKSSAKNAASNNSHKCKSDGALILSDIDRAQLLENGRVSIDLSGSINSYLMCI